jgi:hypothetical protein
MNNKYGDPIRLDEPEEDKIMLEKIMQKYGDRITYIKWQPRDNSNNIVYGQDYATMDFIKRYSHETEWIALMDLDEMLYSQNNINIPDYFRGLPDNVSCVLLGQKKFESRFKTENKYYIQNYRCNSYIYPGGGGSKNIVRTRDFIDLEKIQSINLENFEVSTILNCKELNEIDKSWHLHIHNIIVKMDKITPPEEELRFNHYNTKDVTLTDYDDGMSRYINLFENEEAFASYNTTLYSIQLIFFILLSIFIIFMLSHRKTSLHFTIFIVIATIIIIYSSGSY